MKVSFGLFDTWENVENQKKLKMWTSIFIFWDLENKTLYFSMPNSTIGLNLFVVFIFEGTEMTCKVISLILGCLVAEKMMSFEPFWMIYLFLALALALSLSLFFSSNFPFFETWKNIITNCTVTSSNYWF